ncbi:MULTISPECIES: hypothetical protein [Rhodococcus]|uniref:hypothetical protein n=1 Tax=Rhodococcus TaxID=1827 RepID=UPI000717E13D|nr:MULTISPECIES: hypothetical protein [Rhodococcus]MEA1798299.1 hypothetical protein [Rhodococcus qingshengii]
MQRLTSALYQPCPLRLGTSHANLTEYDLRRRNLFSPLAGVPADLPVEPVLTFLIFASMVRRDATLAPMFSLAPHRSKPDTVRKIVPIAGTYGSEAGLFSVTAVIIGSSGAPAWPRIQWSTSSPTSSSRSRWAFRTVRPSS